MRVSEATWGSASRPRTVWDVHEGVYGNQTANPLIGRHPAVCSRSIFIVFFFPPVGCRKHSLSAALEPLQEKGFSKCVLLEYFHRLDCLDSRRTETTLFRWVQFFSLYLDYEQNSWLCFKKKKKKKRKKKSVREMVLGLDLTATLTKRVFHWFSAVGRIRNTDAIESLDTLWTTVCRENNGCVSLWFKVSDFSQKGATFFTQVLVQNPHFTNHAVFTLWNKKKKKSLDTKAPYQFHICSYVHRLNVSSSWSLLCRNTSKLVFSHWMFGNVLSYINSGKPTWDLWRKSTKVVFLKRWIYKRGLEISVWMSRTDPAPVPTTWRTFSSVAHKGPFFQKQKTHWSNFLKEEEKRKGPRVRRVSGGNGCMKDFDQCLILRRSFQLLFSFQRQASDDRLKQAEPRKS